MTEIFNKIAALPVYKIICGVLRNPWVIAIVGGVIAAIIGAYIWDKLRRRSKKPELTSAEPIESYLVPYDKFYQDLLKERFSQNFVSVRKEGGKERDIIKEFEQALKTEASIIALCGKGGAGKTRILIELCKAHPEFLFINTRAFTRDSKPLIAGLKTHLQQGQVVIFDDIHNHPAVFKGVLDIVYDKKVKLIAATRDPEPIEELKKEQRFKVEMISLGKMDNVAEIVGATGERKRKIEQIAGGIPALAVLAAQYEKLDEVSDAWGLLDSILDDMAKCFPQNGNEVVADIAIRRGVREDDQIVKDNFDAIKHIKRMGYIIDFTIGRQRFFGIDPDILAEHICRRVYFPDGMISPAYDTFLNTLPVYEGMRVLITLINLYRGYNVLRAVDAAERLFAVLLKAKDIKTRTIGFKPEEKIGGPFLPMLIDMTVVAYDGFQNLQPVQSILEQILDPALELGDPRRLNDLGLIFYKIGEPENARKCFEKAISLFEKSKDKIGYAMALHNLAMIHQHLGDYKKARELYEQSLKIFTDLGAKREQAAVLHQLGIIHQEQGEYDRARELYEKSLKTAQELGDKSGIAISLYQLGRIHEEQGEYD
ncbi:MAG: tetratricopeptide repeat protein, partial [candidate division WOR-3 bacterium]